MSDVRTTPAAGVNAGAGRGHRHGGDQAGVRLSIAHRARPDAAERARSQMREACGQTVQMHQGARVG